MKKISLLVLLGSFGCTGDQSDEEARLEDPLNGLYVVESWVENPYSCESAGLRFAGQEGKGVELRTRMNLDESIALDLLHCSGDSCEYGPVSFDTKSEIGWSREISQSLPVGEPQSCWLSYREEKISVDGDKIVIEVRTRENRDIPYGEGCVENERVKDHLAELDQCGLTRIELKKRTAPAVARPEDGSVVDDPINGTYRVAYQTKNSFKCDAEGPPVQREDGDRITITARVDYEVPSGVRLDLDKACSFGATCPLFGSNPTAKSEAIWAGEDWHLFGQGPGCQFSRTDSKLTVEGDEVVIESRSYITHGHLEPDVRSRACLDHVLLAAHRDGMRCNGLEKAVLKRVP